jgi:hypothetical protein
MSNKSFLGSVSSEKEKESSFSEEKEAKRLLIPAAALIDWAGFHE